MIDDTTTFCLRASVALATISMPFLLLVALRLSVGSAAGGLHLNRKPPSHFWATVGLGAVCFVLSQTAQLPFTQWMIQTLLGEDAQEGFNEYPYDGLSDDYGDASVFVDQGSYGKGPTNWYLFLFVLLIQGLWASLCQEGSRWVLFCCFGGEQHSINRYNTAPPLPIRALLVGAGFGGCQTLVSGIAALTALASDEGEETKIRLLENNRHPRQQQVALVLLPLLVQLCWMVLHMLFSLIVWRGFLAEKANLRPRSTTTGLWVAVVLHALFEVVGGWTKEFLSGDISAVMVVGLVVLPLLFLSLCLVYLQILSQQQQAAPPPAPRYNLELDNHNDMWEQQQLQGIGEHYYDSDSDEEQEFGAGSSTGSVPSLDDEDNLIGEA